MSKILRVIDPRLYEQLMQIQQKTEPPKISIKETPDTKLPSNTNLKEFIIKTIEQVYTKKEQDNSCESDNESDIILMKKQRGGGELHQYVKLSKSSIKNTKSKKIVKKNK